MKGNDNVYPSMYLVAEKRIRCIDIEEHVTVSLDCITSPEAAQKLLEPFFENEPYETVYAVAVDTGNRFLGFLRLVQGSVNIAIVHLRKIFTFLLCETNATGLILAHNHPGGSCTPSSEDIALTRRLAQRLTDIQVRLLDHTSTYLEGTDRLRSGSLSNIRFEGSPFRTSLYSSN